MKLTAQEWISFWDAIGDDWYIDESTFPDFQEEKIPPIIEGDAYLCFQGSSRGTTMPSFIKDRDVEDGVLFSTAFRRWKKAQESTSVVVTVHNSRLPEVLAALDALSVNYTKL